MLRVELDPAKAMLGDIHEPLAHSRADNTIYTLGRMNGHNVAITRFLFGVYGTI